MGTISSQGKRSDIQAAVGEVQRAGIRGVAEALPEAYVKYRSGLSSYGAFLERFSAREPPEVRLLLGPSGVGKTRACWERTPKLVSIPGSLEWFDNYMGDEAILFDEFDGALSKVTLKWLLQLLDRYPLRLPIKGGFVAAKYTTVYITSNLHPRDWYDWSSREGQYAALQRRIGRVVHWRTTSQSTRVELDAVHPDWHTWWAGPQPAMVPVLGPMDDYVEHETRDYYNFWTPTVQDEISEEI